MNNITPFPTADTDLLWAAPGTEARRVDMFADTPPRRYRMTDADAPTGAAVVYLIGAATLVTAIVAGWVLGILSALAVM